MPCSNIISFVCKASNPPSVDLLQIRLTSSAKIIVPPNCIDDYKAQWGCTNTYNYYPLTENSYLDKMTAESLASDLQSKDKSKIAGMYFYGGVDESITESVMKDGMNPNCLYFVDDNTGLKGKNIISMNSYSTDEIELTDNYAYENFVPLHAGKITYKHNPTVWATGSAGWETLILPFDVQEYTASSDGMIWPIVLGGTGNFWLRHYVGSSSTSMFFASTTDGLMTANTPYLVAFPGSTMGDGNLEGQTISFIGYDVDMTPDNSPKQKKGNFTFCGNYDTTADEGNGWVLNDAGSSFEQRATVGDKPFQAYFSAPESYNEVKNLRITFGKYDEETNVFTPETRLDSSHSNSIYDLSGRKLDKADHKGIYISDNKKWLKK